MGEPASEVVGLVVVTHERPVDVSRCLAGVLGQSRVPDVVVVVDNSAQSTEVQALAGLDRSRTDIRWVHRPGNVGPAGGFAIGIERCVAAGAGVVLLSDDDDFPESPVAVRATLDALERTSAADDAVIAVGSAGAKLGRSGRLRGAFGSGRRYDVDYLAGSFLPAYRVEPALLDAFDPALWFGFEELGAGLHLERAGFRLLADDRLRQDLGFERKVRAREDLPALREYYSTRNLVDILRHARSPWLATWAAVRSMTAGLARFVRRPGSTTREHLAARMSGVVDAVVGITGPAPSSIGGRERAILVLGRVLRVRGPVRLVRLLRSRFGTGGGPVWVRTIGGVVRADPAGTIGWEVLVTGAYERSMIEAARREVGSDGTATVIDVGAGIGTFSVAMLHVAGTVVSVEPSAALATGLEATRAMNRIGTRSWHIARCSLDDQADEPGCEVMTLDDLAARLDLSNVSLVKIGVEGMEVACLRGGRHVVRAHRPALLFEFDPSRWSSCGYTASDMGEILGDAGYQAYRVAARDGVESVPARFDPSLARGNFLAVPEGLVRHG